MGNEFLYEQLAQKTISTLKKYGVKKIVTPCPHCFHTFHNDYPALGADYEVQHHSTFLNRLVADGKLRGAAGDDGQVTFHDPCYLGRYNQVFDEPRELVRISTGKKTVEMAQSRAASFCCGGGGGMSFTEEPAEQRVNRQRARQVLATGATTVAVACPFCTTMLEDGLGAVAGEKSVQTKDVAELLWESIERAAPT
jgi:Fe-S oxidoreductase